MPEASPFVGVGGRDNLAQTADVVLSGPRERVVPTLCTRKKISRRRERNHEERADAPDRGDRGEKALKFPKEPLLVFINFPEGALDTFLEAMRKTGCCRGILKAVLTPANAVMTPGQLYEELAREREEMRKKS